MSHLVHDMISQLYSMHRSDTTQRKFSWSLSSGGLPDFVYNFTRTQDCFMHTPDGPCVLFELSHSYTDSVLTAIANVQWFLPRVTFLALSTRLPKDDIYRITPQWSDATAVTTTSGFASVRNDIQYTVTASALPMQWDPTRDCFYARVPFDFKVRDFHVVRVGYLTADHYARPQTTQHTPFFAPKSRRSSTKVYHTNRCLATVSGSIYAATMIFMPPMIIKAHFLVTLMRLTFLGSTLACRVSLSLIPGPTWSQRAILHCPGCHLTPALLCQRLVTLHERNIVQTRQILVSAEAATSIFVLAHAARLSWAMRNPLASQRGHSMATGLVRPHLASAKLWPSTDPGTQQTCVSAWSD
jgi:hypothetical protein